MNFDYDVCVIGGCGHVGLPLALCFADKDLKVSVYDINQSAVDMVNNAEMPFMETGCDKILNERVGKNFEYVPLLGDRKPPLDYRKIN